MPESFKVKVGIPNSGLDAYGRPRKPWSKTLTLEDIVISIKRDNPQWEDWLKDELIVKASTYPTGALRHFCNTIDQTAEEIKRKRLEDEKIRNEEN